jgi:phosphoglycerate dehydrogenase-like enzyme
MNRKPTIGVGISMHPDALALLRRTADVQLFAWDAPAQAILGGSAQWDGLIVYTPDLYLKAIGEAAHLQVIGCHSCSAEIARQLAGQGIRVTLTPALWDTVADLTVGLIFAAARNIPQADRAIRAGRWGQGDLKVMYSGLDVFGKTAGILGLGRIGAIVARRLQGFDMHMLYHDILRRPGLETSLKLEYVSLQDLLTLSDFLIILAPLNDATRGLLGEPELRSMKTDAILINTARGAIVDPQALYRALSQGWIRAAGLDVFAQEPLPAGDPLFSLENVVLTPHLGGSSKECDMTLVEDALRVLNGLEPLHPA